MGRMYAFGGHGRAQGIKGSTLTGKCHLVDTCLIGDADLSDQEGTIEARFKAVEIGHAAKAQEHRFAVAHDPRSGAVVGFGDRVARGHDLKKCVFGDISASS
jgi:hypothetical protein